MIRRLEVRNFKSLRDISVSLGPRNVLVGPNMSGKSNLMSVFRFLRQMVTPRPESSAFRTRSSRPEGSRSCAGAEGISTSSRSPSPVTCQPPTRPVPQPIGSIALTSSAVAVEP
jgi:predicted ATP-binding protein involved in virulence